ncbi:hypothetical protein C8Q74DRAFT_1366299 [Fomes fomentarius]|nr:hypothetical protein C8Q74DRAFT_1366299 [Fomes fomentarius]
MRSTYSDGKEIVIDFLTWECQAVPLTSISAGLKGEQPDRDSYNELQRRVLINVDERPAFPREFTEDHIVIFIPCETTRGTIFIQNMDVYNACEAACEAKRRPVGAKICCSLKGLSTMGELAYRVVDAINVGYTTMGLDVWQHVRDQSLRQIYRRCETDYFEVVLVKTLAGTEQAPYTLHNA